MKDKKDNGTFPTHSSLTHTNLSKGTSSPADKPVQLVSTIGAPCEHARGDLLLYSCWCTRNAPVASPGGNARCRPQALLTRELERFQGILSHSGGFSLHQHIIRVGPIHDGIMLHDTVHSH